MLSRRKVEVLTYKCFTKANRNSKTLYKEGSPGNIFAPNLSICGKSYLDYVKWNAFVAFHNGLAWSERTFGEGNRNSNNYIGNLFL